MFYPSPYLLIVGSLFAKINLNPEIFISLPRWLPSVTTGSVVFFFTVVPAPWLGAPSILKRTRIALYSLAYLRKHYHKGHSN